LFTCGVDTLVVSAYDVAGGLESGGPGEAARTD
jgi:hypothetical protein